MHDTNVTLTMTCTDWALFQETYAIYDLVIYDYIWFYARQGFFDEYIDKYGEEKRTSKGFKRQKAKLFLNNLYGKFAMSDNSSYKEPYLDEDGIIRFILHEGFCYADTDSIHIIGTEKAEKVVEHSSDFCCWKCESTFDFAYYERQKPLLSLMSL